MPATPLDTAILLFSRSAAEEAVAKVFKPGFGQGNARIASHLVRHSQQIAKQSGFPVYFISENKQQGASFGVRFANAFEQLFALGYERVISIGNDCPNLDAADLQLAASSLERVACVFGPATDGGAYLIGIHRHAYKRENFVKIKWQTSQVFGHLVDFAEGNYTCLEQKADIDTWPDLQRLLRLGELPLLLRIRLLCCLNWQIVLPIFEDRAPLQSVFLHSVVLRGPPSLFSF